MKFDGREFAREIEAILRQRLRSGMRVPKVVSVLVGSDPASELYTKLKTEAAQRVGIEYEVVRIEREKGRVEELRKLISKIGEREEVTGVMVQMPIPGLTRAEMEEVVCAIPLQKDVDGLRWEESGKIPATVKAIFLILEKIQVDKGADIYNKNYVVVGSHGSVGKPLVHFLKDKGVGEIEEVNSQTGEKQEILKKAEVVISCVGKEGVITGEMVSEGAIVIDVGSPRGDMTEEVYQKATVAVPAPGGVGPVTVASLMENAAEVVE
ncbi:MAG: bifunctional 5,10-methylenetetrahydrofolate dehydrogenase/5,10-methenyltetrahydrofolate cyclohydrolase [bacterium]